MNSKKVEIINQILINLKTNLQAVNTAYCDTSWYGTDCVFPYDSIGFIVKGTLFLKVRDIEFTPHEGNIYFLPAKTPLTYRVHNCNEAIIHWCHFKSSIGTQTLFDLIQIPITTKVINTFYIDKIFKEMINCWNSNCIGMPVKINGLLLELVYCYISFLPEEMIKIKNDEFSIAMNEVLQYIDKHLSNPITIDELADIAGFNSNYFIGIFKKYFNTTPIKYILNKKEEEAKKMLIYSNMSIKEIGDNLGFSNQNYFSEFFKKRTGYSPLVFRKMKNSRF